MRDLRIVAWNLAHQICKKPIQVALAEGILSLSPDVVVLTEYVDGPADRIGFCTVLRSGGLVHLSQTPSRPRHNGVLIASRFTTSVLPFILPAGLTSHAASNCLNVQLDDLPLNLVGVRVPDCKTAPEKKAYWDWFETAIRPLVEQNAVIIGDFNTDPHKKPRSKSPGSKHLNLLAEAGWQLKNPTGPWSFIPHKPKKPSRIDHALVSPSLTVKSARYVTSENGYSFAGDGQAYFSDHALLVLDITTGA
jgi:exonuclease III